MVDYTHTLLGTEKVQGEECYKIELTPLPDAPVVWGKIILWVAKNNFIQWKTEFYDEDKILITTHNSYNIKKYNDRELPSKIEVIPADKKDQKTIIEMTDMVFDKPIDDALFTQQNMKKVK
ncbi:MAG: outer membrane lipoprotein-sorting protein [Bacteroidia bacterium]|nr:outer membrane lipoprotein-sorting protein [Bacteroidia bacterium]